MPFTLIKGTFEPSFGNPDGDSLRFVPDNPDPIFRLERRGRAPKLNQNNGSIQLRYEAIDTMEKSAGSFAEDATRSNLDLAGTDNGENSSRGYICTNQLGPNGRPICFVFSGDADQQDGAEVFLSPEDILGSINVQQLRLGHAYPLYYDTLYDDLREACTEAMMEAKADGLGVWPSDQTNTGVEWPGDVDNLPPIFPKLWRRIDKFQRDDTFFDPSFPLRNFLTWLRQQRDERVLILPDASITGFDNIIQTTDDSIQMDIEPQDLVIVSVQ